MRKAKEQITGLCRYDDFAPVFPVPISRRQVLRLADRKLFPPYVRPSGFKGEPVFSRLAVVDWFRATYGDFLPDLIAEIERDGLAIEKGRSHHARNV